MPTAPVQVLLDSDELGRAWPLSAAEQEQLNRADLTAFRANAAALGHSRQPRTPQARGKPGMEGVA